jgi:hypothetical protein
VDLAQWPSAVISNGLYIKGVALHNLLPLRERKDEISRISSI